MNNLIENRKSDHDLCVEFVKVALAKAKEKGNETIYEFQTRVHKLERFFSYNADALKTSYIPKQIRDELRSLGLTLRKRRDREIVYIFCDINKMEENVKNG